MFSSNNPPQSVCILRLSALGDVTHVLPVLNAIRQQYPGADITWICGSIEYKLLSCIPGVKFVVFNKNEGLKAYWRARKALGNRRFDLLLHMQVSARANLLSLFIKSDIRLGWDKNSSRDLHQWFINRRIETGTQRHQVQGFLAFARAIGIDYAEPVWNIPVPVEAYEFADRYVDNMRKTLLISPCSSRVLRNWLPEHYAAVADYAFEQLSMQVILSGGPSELEHDFGRQIESAMQHQALNLIGQDTLQQSLALLQKVDIVIAPDTGPAHMANAMGTKVIGLYACTNPQRTGPYNSLDICIDKYAEAAEKFLHKANADELPWGKKIEQPGVMELIIVNEVIEKLNQLVKD
jgi:heptosyltransferase I